MLKFTFLGAPIEEQHSVVVDVQGLPLSMDHSEMEIGMPGRLLMHEVRIDATVEGIGWDKAGINPVPSSVYRITSSLEFLDVDSMRKCWCSHSFPISWWHQEFFTSHFPHHECQFIVCMQHLADNFRLTEQPKYLICCHLLVLVFSKHSNQSIQAHDHTLYHQILTQRVTIL